MWAKKTKYLLIFAIFIFGVGCGNSRPVHTDSGKGQTTQTVVLTDNQAKDTLNEIIPKAIEIYAMFNGKGYFKFDETKTIPGDEVYCLVTGVNGKSAIDTNNIKSIADLKKVVEDVFTKDSAQKLFYSRYLEMKDIGLPVYKDYEGQLYVNTKNGGHGWGNQYLIDTAKIKSQKDNVVEIELDRRVLSNPPEKITITIEYVNGKWLLASSLV